ncbi:MAG: aspartate aminotransferase family protein [Pirellulales bacterium]
MNRNAAQADAEAKLRQEGDVNLSPLRQAWEASAHDAATRQLLAEDSRYYIHQALSTPCLDVVTACEGIYLYDGRGRAIIDFHGNSAHQVGYRHPRVLAAVVEQLQSLPFAPRRFTNEPAIELARRLASLAPGRLNKILLAPGGTSAIGIALKMARYATGRYKTISMWGTFHGASLDAISVGGEDFFRDGLGPLLPGAFHVPWPRDENDLALMEEIFVREGDIGAVLAEPMRCTTIDRPTNAYWQGVRELCDRHGALLIFDEIPLALGRTGRMFCCEHVGVTPDLLVLGKGLGGAVFPLAAVIARDDLDCAADRALGHYTHEKTPVGAAAALAVLDVIRDENLLLHAEEIGHYATSKLRQLQHECSAIGEIRSLGLAIGVVLSGPPEVARRRAERILYGCLSRGLSFKISDGNVLTLFPPLVITYSQMDQALQMVADTVREVLSTEN